MFAGFFVPALCSGLCLSGLSHQFVIIQRKSAVIGLPKYFHIRILKSSDRCQCILLAASRSKGKGMNAGNGIIHFLQIALFQIQFTVCTADICFYAA